MNQRRKRHALPVVSRSIGPAGILACLWLLLQTTAAGAQVTFTNVSRAAGLNPDRFLSATAHGLGINWIDFNSDGWPDLFLINGIDMPCHLYQNDGDGTFTAVDELLPALPNYEMMGSVFADYDNDGDQDIYIFTDNPVKDFGPLNPIDGPPNIFLKNLWVENGEAIVAGQPLFEDVTAAAGLTDVADPPFGELSAYRSSTGGWIDFDRDGHVDLYVAHWACGHGGDPANRDRFYRNQGDGTFIDYTVQSGLSSGEDPTHFRPALVFLGAHLDNDLWPDIYVDNVSDPSPYHHDMVFKNFRGTFVDVTDQSPGIGNDSEAGMGIAVGDVDLDGDWDLYITDMFQTTLDDPPLGNVLYLNQGNGKFFDNSAPTAGVVARASWGTNLFDADLDGDEDLFVGGMTRAQSFFYLNDGFGNFTDVSGEAGLAIQHNVRGSAVADFDRDGDLDLAVVGQRRKLYLFRNNYAGTGHWLQIKLVGSESNRDAIGAVVRARTPGGRTMQRQVIGGQSAHSQDDLTVHFGLAESDVVERIQIRWPERGSVKELVNIPAQQRLTITEGETE